MAPTAEAASPIGIANVSGGIPVKSMKLTRSVSSCPIRGLCPSRSHGKLSTRLTGDDRHKIVAKRGAAFTIMVRSLRRAKRTVLLKGPRRLQASQDWGKRPLSTHFSPQPSRITPITDVVMLSRLTRPLRSRSLKPNWKRNSLKVLLKEGLAFRGHG